LNFEKAGRENSEQSLEIAKDEALKRGISHMVVASTVGDTGLQMARMLEGIDIELVVVTHSTGHTGPGKQVFDAEVKAEIERMGGVVFTGTDALTGYEIAMGSRRLTSTQAIISATLRMFGQGIKVCVEIVAMAGDAGLIPLEDVIAVAGTARGADTVAVIGANSTNQFFDIKVREILAKPSQF
jgi:hypothetical protein|tara:strand:+ start:1663 stop:2214 length:552 start_codon:yes stop_codon:yes gene_type:complete